jgi:hypothetical protein
MDVSKGACKYAERADSEATRNLFDFGFTKQELGRTAAPRRRPLALGEQVWQAIKHVGWRAADMVMLVLAGYLLKSPNRGQRRQLGVAARAAYLTTVDA